MGEREHDREHDDELEQHPGKPRGTDEIDPELVSLRRNPVSAGPLLSIAIIVFCGYTMVQLWPDLRFSRAAEEPHETGDPSEIAERDGFGPEELVRTRAVPDRSFALRVSPSGTTEGHRVAPVLGTSGRLWLMVGSEPWAAEPAYDDVYTGRLRELGDMPFAGSLREHVKERGPVPRAVTPEALREALEAGAEAVDRPSGDPVPLAPDTVVELQETVRDQALVRAFFRPDRLPDIATWNRVLSEAGLVPPGTEPIETDEAFALYQVDAPDGVRGVQKALYEAKIFAARALPLERDHEASWAELEASAAGVQVGEKTRVPWGNLSAVEIRAPRNVPPDALVLIDGERPGDYWYVLPLYVLLGLFAALFAWALVRALRPDRSAAAPAGASNEARSAA